MLKQPKGLLLGVVLLGACDPSYYAQVQLLVTDATTAKPVEGAVVVTEFQKPTKPLLRTDSSGAASFLIGGFLRSPDGPIAIYKDGYRLWVGERGNGYAVIPKEDGLWGKSKTEFTVDLSVTLLQEKGGVGFPIQCEPFSARVGPLPFFYEANAENTPFICSALIPMTYAEQVTGSLLVLQGESAYIAPLRYSELTPDGAGQGGGKFLFPLFAGLAPGTKIFGIFSYWQAQKEEQRALGPDFTLVSDPFIVP